MASSVFVVTSSWVISGIYFLIISCSTSAAADSAWGNFNPGARLSTDASGTLIVSDRFAFGGVGQRVWVTAGGLESNHYLWPSG